MVREGGCRLADDNKIVTGSRSQLPAGWDGGLAVHDRTGSQEFPLVHFRSLPGLHLPATQVPHTHRENTNRIINNQTLTGGGR